MGRVKILIPKRRLYFLYHKKNLTPKQIGRLFGCDAITVRNRIKEHRLSFKSPAAARMKYAKSDFDGDDIESAYLLGFRLGDLNVYVPGKGSETVVARCHSTKNDQINLFKSLFGRYGKVTISKSRGDGMHVNAFLNRSFNFLVPKYSKYIKQIIGAKKESWLAFIAGYTDAEGNFGINQGRGRFKIDSYDKDILDDINNKLISWGISTKYRCIARKGDKRENGVLFNDDLWRLNVNSAQSLELFISMVYKYLRHSKRRADVRRVLFNIAKRRRDGTIK